LAKLHTFTTIGRTSPPSFFCDRIAEHQAPDRLEPRAK
jgi:hypothetical protein